MTDSKIIEREAIKLAEAVSAESNQVSLTSLDLDAINPPSAMGSLVSLTASIGGIADNADNSDKSRCQSTSNQSANLFARKKSLPIGVVARRALNYGQSRTGSLENLLNECNNGNHSQLENVKPPSIMDELVDVGDMENSMLSVASITSEIVDSKDNSLTSSDPVFDLIKPVANVLSMTCMRYAEAMQASGQNSLSECFDNSFLLKCCLYIFAFVDIIRIHIFLYLPFL
ncbi:hypothetical protein QAD02_013880 [Eretmocerus hayati]|uniref:Uncharacterized protein n=1 Tax=Eretmocerus hayati TaxID=131215 RepID=A0ACC2P4Q6_9HYME|nr:hypothetical protein QAD02_013880 [Eretmocerus hayati]